MAESVQTHSAGPPRPDYAAPMVTTLAAIEERGVVHGRQDRDQCGFFMFPSMIYWTTWDCGSLSSTQQYCNTFDDYFGCSASIWITCYPWSRGCDNRGTVGTREITAFDYANVAAQVSIYASTDISTSQSYEENSSTTADPTTEPSTSVEQDPSTNVDPTTTESAPASQASSSDDKNSPPIGLIVGGVIGGLTLIALIGFGAYGLFVARSTIPAEMPAATHQETIILHPSYGYIDHTSPDPQYNHPPMCSTPSDISQNFGSQPYVVTPQSSELPSTPGRPKTPEMR
ncbi:unnamed protein product [Fusarium graminearum]|uniref:Uncharacterized protein n=1 Tax=Gibberella zeae TaxID=5518 RepID=A0A4E9EKW0_GIBZA|nr:unnamed protein product [Fusarium graminearum]CAG1980817.1 unnamed protein product [Fusarium graminearum]CAG2005039.1 unnamed protein product [Fusarium graminearum]